MSPSENVRSASVPSQGRDVAIIGMACLFPGAPNLDAYWQNIVSGVDAITDVPADRWDPAVFYDAVSSADDRLYCKRGGYLGDLSQFNPLDYGIMPNTVDGGEPEQFLSLWVAHEAIADAGLSDRPFNRERTEIILGRGNYLSRGNFNLTMYTLVAEQTLQVLRTLHPNYTAEDLAAIKRDLKASLAPFGPDIAGSLIPNLTTGRVANRLDLMGVNFTVDAACASALIATDLAVRDLLTHRCDLALVGGVHVATHVPFLAVFCQLNALSRRSEIRPFDALADGTLTGEGVGVMVLRRREDAEREGDRIYAVIKGVGTASDGRGQGLLAPRVEGEELAIRRAYEMADLHPRTVELIEAHGTGTPVGDLAEIQALSRVFGVREGRLPTCAIGSVKSMIGHAMPAAGIAGLIKAALAVYHKVLPPTLHCETPNPKFELEKTPFYVNTKTRPWIHGAEESPRRAGVNAFGFGGINAHVILEEHLSGVEGRGSSRPLHWETEVCVVQGASRGDLIAQVQRLERYLDAAGPVRLKDLAYSLNTELRDGSVRLAVVASSLEDLRQKLTQARERLQDPACRQIKDVQGLYFFEEPLRWNGKLAFLFPGEASQYPNMLKDLCIHFPEIREVFDSGDRRFIKKGRPFLPSQSIFPIPMSSDAECSEVEGRLWEMGGALEAVLIANWAVYTLLRRLEIQPDTLLGHSAGEYSALAVSGILADEAVALECLISLSGVSERLTAERKVPEAVMATVGTDRRFVTPLLEQFAGQVYLSHDNCPHQVVIAGREDAVEKTIDHLRAEGVICQKLPFNRAYHTPMFASVSQLQREFLQGVPLCPPQIETYSSSTMAPYPRDLNEIRELVTELWSRPVEFAGSIEAVYDAGVRIFVEVGPKGNLTAFVDDILRGRPHLAIPCDAPQRSGITQLNHLIGALAAQGVGMRLDYLYDLRAPRRLSLDEATTVRDQGEKYNYSRRLPLGLPVMQLSSTGAVSLGAEPPAATAGLPTVSGGKRQRPMGSPDFGSLSTPGELLELEAHVASGLNQAGAFHPSSGAAAQAMHEHLQTMEHFLAVENQVVEAFLAGAGSAWVPEMAETPAAAVEPPLPFIGTVVSMTPGREVVMRRRIDADEDILLQDHSFVRRISEADEMLEDLPTVPLTLCIEIMAEAAALLMPGKVFTGMRQIQARKWLEVGDPITLEITARKRASAEEVEVQVRNLDDVAETDRPAAPPTVEGIAIFGDGYSPAPPVAPLSLTSEQPCRHTAERMYEERLICHGPRFRAVASLDGWGENGMRGQLQVLPATNLFRFTTAPHLLIDPVLLDAAGQLLGYWATRLENGYVVFPFRLAALEIYGPKLRVSERARCELEIQQVTHRTLRVTMNLFGPDGSLLLRLVDWEDWRFLWPRELYDFIRFPKRNPLTTAWERPSSALSQGKTLVCQQLRPTPEHTRGVMLRTLASMILSRAERQEWRNLRGPENRRIDWLYGRAAAKDAVRRLLKERDEMDIWPADVEVGHDQNGRPFVSVFGLGESATMPSISIAHTDGLIVAMAGYCSDGERLGIDVERVRPREEAFRQIAFHGEELALLDMVPDSARDEWVARFWCAKEAVAKALGQGLVEGPRSLIIRKLDTPTGMVEVVLGNGLARGFPELAGIGLVVCTAREEDWVVASTLCQPERSA